MQHSWRAMALSSLRAWQRVAPPPEREQQQCIIQPTCQACEHVFEGVCATHRQYNGPQLVVPASQTEEGRAGGQLYFSQADVRRTALLVLIMMQCAPACSAQQQVRRTQAPQIRPTSSARLISTWLGLSTPARSSCTSKSSSASSGAGNG